MKDLLKKLIQAQPTLGKGELEAAKVLADYFASFGIDTRIEQWGNSRANISLHIDSAGEKKALLFAAHLDVVPPGEASWKFPPFEAVEFQDRIYGRGAADMKAGIVALAAAIVEIIGNNTKFKGDLIFAATAGEETDSCGAKRFVEKEKSNLPELAGIVIPEPTNFKIVTAHRGMLWIQIETSGKTAHGSMPQFGINAISSMNMLLNQLNEFKFDFPEHPRLGSCSISINEIHGGKATNVVPDSCLIRIDIRTLPGQNHEQVMQEFQNIVDELTETIKDFDAELTFIRSVKATESDDTCDFIQSFCKVADIPKTTTVGFCTDSPFFGPLNAPVVIFGPGKPDVCHKPDEHVDLVDLDTAKEYYKKIISKFLT